MVYERGWCNSYPHFCMCAESLQLSLTLWNPMDCVACQAPLSRGLFMQEYWSGLPCPTPGEFPSQRSNPCLLNLLQLNWSGLPFPSPGDLLNLGIEPPFPALQRVLYHLVTSEGLWATRKSPPTLAGGFFITNAPWEAPILVQARFFIPLLSFKNLFCFLQFECCPSV